MDGFPRRIQVFPVQGRTHIFDNPDIHRVAESGFHRAAHLLATRKDDRKF